MLTIEKFIPSVKNTITVSALMSAFRGAGWHPFFSVFS
jgi:hypothetical protein